LAPGLAGRGGRQLPGRAAAAAAADQERRATGRRNEKGRGGGAVLDEIAAHARDEPLEADLVACELASQRLRRGRRPLSGSIVVGADDREAARLDLLGNP
jgi:hypothetical protein